MTWHAYLFRLAYLASVDVYPPAHAFLRARVGSPVIFGTIVGFVFLFFVILAKTRRNRRMIRERLQQEYGLHYTAKTDDAYRDAWSVLPEVEKRGSVTHLFVGEVDGREICIFQHSRQEGITMIGTTPAPRIVSFSVYSTPAPGWPDFSITPRGWWSRRAVRRGTYEGFLTGDEAFDERWEVQTDDPEFVRTLLTPAMREFLRTKHDVRWRVVGERLCMIYAGCLAFSHIAGSIERLRRFWSLVPFSLQHTR